jgi:hypothetical protein
LSGVAVHPDAAPCQIVDDLHRKSFGRTAKHDGEIVWLRLRMERQNAMRSTAIHQRENVSLMHRARGG